MDDWNIETIQDPYLHYLNYQRSLLSVFIKYCYQSYYTVNNRDWIHVQFNVMIHCNAPLKGNQVSRDD